MLDEKPTWQECFAAGMTAKQASEARGTCLSAAHGWSKRQGLKWPRPDNRAILSAKAKLRYATDPARRRQNAEHLASMKEKRAAAMRKWAADPTKNRLARLTAAERAEYEFLKRSKGIWKADDRLRMIGRADLINPVDIEDRLRAAMMRDAAACNARMRDAA